MKNRPLQGPYMALEIGVHLYQPTFILFIFTNLFFWFNYFNFKISILYRILTENRHKYNMKYYYELQRFSIS